MPRFAAAFVCTVPPVMVAPVISPPDWMAPSNVSCHPSDNTETLLFGSPSQYVRNTRENPRTVRSPSLSSKPDSFARMNNDWSLR